MECFLFHNHYIHEKESCEQIKFNYVENDREKGEEKQEVFSLQYLCMCERG